MLDNDLQQQLISQGREFTRGHRESDPYPEFESDQDLKRPMPPLVKAPMAGEESRISLPRDFSSLPLDVNLAELFFERRSARRYTQEPMSLTQLSFLLWSTQGIKKIRGKGYATLRTVPSGGARHPFETYLAVNQVDSLRPGIYHYLPMEHALERIGDCADPDETISRLLEDQSWAARANVVFFWSMVPGRAEWRYGIHAHRPALMDAGHMGQNLYLAATALGLGTCAIAAFSHEACCRVFSLDGEEEYVVYSAPVGTVSPANHDAEERFTYRHVYEE